jgi:hypothetical protein
MKLFNVGVMVVFAAGLSIAAAGLRSSASGDEALRSGAASSISQGAQTAIADALVSLEKKSWEAWKNRDNLFFEQFLSDDHVEMGFTGPANKALVVKTVATPNCTVKSYTVDDFKVTVFSADAAVVTYHAAQDTICGGAPVPSPVWVSSTYIKHGDRWLNAVYQQSQDLRKK